MFFSRLPLDFALLDFPCFNAYTCTRLIMCMVCGVWCVVYGVWCVVCGVWCVVCGVWCMGYGVWGMVYGVWCMVYGVWCVVYGVWCMVCGVCMGVCVPLLCARINLVNSVRSEVPWPPWTTPYSYLGYRFA